MEAWNAGKALGPAFESEMRTRFGDTKPPLSYGADGTFVFFDAATAQQIIDVKAVAVAHNPATAAPLAARGTDFAEVVFSGLSGARQAGKLARALVLIDLSPKILNFFNLLGVTTPSSARIALLKAVWVNIKTDPLIGVTGAAPAHLTATEASAIEANGIAFGLVIA